MNIQRLRYGDKTKEVREEPHNPFRNKPEYKGTFHGQTVGIHHKVLTGQRITLNVKNKITNKNETIRYAVKAMDYDTDWVWNHDTKEWLSPSDWDKSVRIPEVKPESKPFRPSRHRKLTP